MIDWANVHTALSDRDQISSRMSSAPSIQASMLSHCRTNSVSVSLSIGCPGMTRMCLLGFPDPLNIPFGSLSSALLRNPKFKCFFDPNK